MPDQPHYRCVNPTCREVDVPTPQPYAPADIPADMAGVIHCEMCDQPMAYAPPPYPWCTGEPTVVACIRRGFCGRKPSCGD